MTALSAALTPSRRIDKWLWCARRFKTRSLAASFVSEANVRVTRNGATLRVEKPSFQLCEGDVVSYLQGEKLVVLYVVGFAARRGAPGSQRLLYRTDMEAGVSSSPAAPACEDPACKANG